VTGRLEEPEPDGPRPLNTFSPQLIVTLLHMRRSVMDDQSLDQRPRRPGRRLGVLLMVLVVALGSAAVAYNFGLARGFDEAATAAGGTLTPPPYYGYYYGPRPWGFGLFGPFLFLAFWFVVLRGLIWRGPWHRGGRGGGPRSGMSRFDEWHGQAHERIKGDASAVTAADVNR
jgi:hypothetical protein